MIIQIKPHILIIFEAYLWQLRRILLKKVNNKLHNFINFDLIFTHYHRNLNKSISCINPQRGHLHRQGQSPKIMIIIIKFEQDNLINQNK